MKPTPEQTAAVDAAITSRKSIRAFLPTPVPRETIEDTVALQLNTYRAALGCWRQWNNTAP